MIARAWKASATPEGARRYAEHVDGAALHFTVTEGQVA